MAAPAVRALSRDDSDTPEAAIAFGRHADAQPVKGIVTTRRDLD
jgi:hypothetical protein